MVGDPWRIERKLHRAWLNLDASTVGLDDGLDARPAGEVGEATLCKDRREIRNPGSCGIGLHVNSHCSGFGADRYDDEVVGVAHAHRDALHTRRRVRITTPHALAVYHDSTVPSDLPDKVADKRPSCEKPRGAMTAELAVAIELRSAQRGEVSLVEVAQVIWTSPGDGHTAPGDPSADRH